jgi:hypothetical protein
MHKVLGLLPNTAKEKKLQSTWVKNLTKDIRDLRSWTWWYKNVIQYLGFRRILAGESPVQGQPWLHSEILSQSSPQI